MPTNTIQNKILSQENKTKDDKNKIPIFPTYL